ncbi:polymerase [Stutzerimonas balearica]|uniref:O-antigen ligase family protein n=1 Tax=Stutzerimonas balearica TaxID=74829 RepID=UPI0013F4B910|nr:O-antigen ligase family protein [Stutzerimonas balearica]QII99526.1 polymerase [Stutzerimonas balearica]
MWRTEQRLIAFMAAGYLWFLLGIAWAPSNKLYQQGLVVLLWLPALVSAVVFRSSLVATWQSARTYCTLLLALAGWAAISCLWSDSVDPVRHLKRVLFVLLFLSGLVVLSSERPRAIWKGLAVGFVGLALSGGVGIYVFYVRDMHSLVERLQGIGEVSHPILGAYVMAIAAIWGALSFPQGLARRLVWFGLLLLVMLFIALGQSRGAMLALAVGIGCMPLLGGGRGTWICCLVLVIAAGVGYHTFEPLILQRGLSYRPEIFLASVEMIMRHPLQGIGIGTPYRVVTANYPAGFDHSHNAFTHVGIQLGLVGVALWTMAWASAVWTAWQHRRSREGRLVLGSLIVSFVALQFDAASLWGTPRAEWFVTWLPLGLALALVARRQGDRLRTGYSLAS